MKRRLSNLLRESVRDESGTASLEFVMVVPLFFVLLLFSIELGFVTLRATMLERGLDIAVREIRLGTGNVPTHDQTKAIICENAIIISNCTEKLQLEMVPNDLRNYVTLNTTPDCTDTAEPTKPVRAFIAGAENQLMVLRACVKFEPIFPNAILGAALGKDSSGEAALVATTAFVQEPT
mgnify:CR=1 FL=1